MTSTPGLLREVARAACCLPLLWTTLDAQQASSSSGSSVSGTVHLITEDGERRTAGGRTISLVRDSDTLRARLADVCRSHERQMQLTRDSLDRSNKAVGDTMQAPREDPWTAYWGHETSLRTAKTATRRALASSSRLSIRQLLVLAAVDSTTSTADGRYHFDRVQPGHYIVFSEWAHGPLIYQWWRPIDLREGTTLTHNLTSSMAAADQLFCGYR